MEVTWNGRAIYVNLFPGGVFDVEGGAVRFGYGSGQTSWNNNQGSLNIAAGATVDLWDYVTYPVRVDLLTGGGTLTETFTSGANLTMGVANGSGTFTGTISGGLSLTKTGSGVETLNGSLGYSGPTTVNGGQLVITGTAANIGAVSIANGGELTFSGTDVCLAARQCRGPERQRRFHCQRRHAANR